MTAQLARAAILAVGSEMLTPYRLDTNSLFLTEQLNALGIDVVFKQVVGDDRDELGFLFSASLVRVPLVIVTGGLGPTDDDVTREVVAKILNRRLSEDPERTDALRKRFAARGLGIPMPEINRRQAMVPEGAVVIENAHGSAPGLWLEDGDRVVLLLPGPPRELRPMVVDSIVPRLRSRAGGVGIVRRELRIAGSVESQVDQALQPLYREWEQRRPPIAATILAKPGAVDLHLSIRAVAVEAATALDEAVSQVLTVLGDRVYSTDGRALEAVVGEWLADRGWTVAVAESCTGGLVTSRLTDVPGSSRYVRLSVVTYSNAAKVSQLGVDESLLAAHGAVSEPVARAMAAGVRRLAGADVGLGITGIAGPDGGSAEKPVGTVVIAIEAPDAYGGLQSRLHRFPGERDRVKFQASQAALDLLRRTLTPRGQ